METAVSGITQHTGVVEFADGAFGIRCTDGVVLFLCFVAGSFTVIGNIHDNPELLAKNSAIDDLAERP
ncbi:MAG: YopX family protein [Faecousia sp.]